jgi:predicted MFS family arabinose efflux permease
MADHTAPNQRGLASGLRSMANRGAQFANPVLFGALTAAFGLSTAFWVLGASMVLLATACVIAFRRMGPSRFRQLPETPEA